MIKSVSAKLSFSQNIFSQLSAVGKTAWEVDIHASTGDVNQSEKEKSINRENQKTQPIR